jgi:hypothetical protein
MSAFWAYLAVHFSILGHLHPATVVNVVFFAVLSVGMTVGLAVVAVRTARAGLWMGSGGVVLRGVFKTRSFALNAVTGFAPKVGSSYACPWLNRPHRRPLLVSALSLGGLGGATALRAQQLQPVCDELNALLKTLQSTYPCETPVPDPEEAHKESVRESRRVGRGLLATAVAYWIGAGAFFATHPTAVVGVCAGALGVLYTSYTYLVSRLMKKSATHQTGSTGQDRRNIGL